MNDFSINDNDFLRQFEVEINGKLAKVEYALQERKIFLTKIIIPENTDDNFKEEFLVSIFELMNYAKIILYKCFFEKKQGVHGSSACWCQTLSSTACSAMQLKSLSILSK